MSYSIYLSNTASDLLDLHLVDATLVRCQAASNTEVIIDLLHSIADLVCHDLATRLEYTLLPNSAD